MTAVGAVAIIPWGDVQHIFGTKVGLYGMDVSVGPLYVFALSGISFYGIMLGGWASGSKYSFLGSMRAAAQLISYEVSQGLALVGVLITAQTLSLVGIVNAQKGMWYFIPQFCGFLIFMVASFAEVNRAPFDLVEADAELVGGYFTEYGGTGFVAYLFAEYVNMIVVSALAATIFFGGWLMPFGIHPPGWVDPIIVFAKMMVVHHLLHLDPGDAAAAALRPADVVRMEDVAAAGDLEPARDGDIVVDKGVMTYDPSADVIEVIRHPAPGPAAGDLPDLRRDVAGAEDDVRAGGRGSRARSSTRRRRLRSTRASGGATSSIASRIQDSRSASAARCARPHARRTASASSPPRTRLMTASRPASATRRCTRSI